jgi:signal transduction histidine kinase
MDAVQPKDRIDELERKLRRQDYQLSILQHLAGVFATMPKPNQVAKILLGTFCREFKAKTIVIWLKARNYESFKPFSGVGLSRERWKGWKLPAPNPFPHAPMLLLQPQRLEKQVATPDMEPLLGPEGNLPIFYIPFNYSSNLMGFALMGVDPDHPLDEDFGTISMLGQQVAASLFNSYLFMDMSDQRDELKAKAIELEKANEDLTKIDRFKNEFLVITSHELRTPLTGVLGFIKFVIDGLYEDEKEMQQMLQDSYSSGKYLLKLLNDILDLAKIESGRLEVNLVQVSLPEIFVEIRSIANSIPKKPSVEINWPDSLDSIPDILADPDRFSQVMINLISNSLKFTPEGSVSVAAERGIGFVSFSIEDTGIGISAKAQARLFQKFVQADSGRTREYGGTGLGLVISKHLVEMMGGTIALHSDGEGCGTTIKFTVPIA